MDFLRPDGWTSMPNPFSLVTTTTTTVAIFIPSVFGGGLSILLLTETTCSVRTITVLNATTRVQRCIFDGTHLDFALERHKKFLATGGPISGRAEATGGYSCHARPPSYGHRRTHPCKAGTGHVRGCNDELTALCTSGTTTLQDTLTHVSTAAGIARPTCSLIRVCFSFPNGDVSPLQKKSLLRTICCCCCKQLVQRKRSGFIA